MQRKDFKNAGIFALGCIALSARASAQSLPPDVRAGHWAAAPVQAVLRNHVLNLETDQSFHGDAKVTHTEAVIALARLGQALETGVWQGNKSTPITFAKTGISPQKGAWEGQPISRYVFATVLTRMADYANNGLVRARPNEKDTGKSTILPAPPATKIPKSSPAYAALTYLIGRRMIAPGSVLLTPDDKPLKATEMSRALRELMIGLTDRVTDIGHDADGNTHDEALHTKKPPHNN